MSSSGRALGILLVVSTSVGCSQQVAPPAHAQDQQDLQGVASWYGHPFDGRLTASGKIYNMEELTAAHRTLPFGTRLRVQRLDTSKTVDITVNDRGPYVKDRIIDLSHAAAQSLDMQGTSEVRLSVLYKPASRGFEMYAVQIGEFDSKGQADQARERVGQSYGPVRLVYREEDRRWRVLVGEQPSEALASAIAGQLKKQDMSFVVLIDSD